MVLKSSLQTRTSKGSQHKTYEGKYKSYKYEPNSSVLTGTLKEMTFYSAPGYGETPKIDSKKTFLILVLNSPISVVADKGDELNISVDSVSQLQLISMDPKHLKPFLGKQITLSGTLFHSHSPDHNTEVLLFVNL